MSRRPHAAWLRSAGPGSSPACGPLLLFFLHFPVALHCLSNKAKKSHLKAHLLKLAQSFFTYEYYYLFLIRGKCLSFFSYIVASHSRIMQVLAFAWKRTTLREDWWSRPWSSTALPAKYDIINIICPYIIYTIYTIYKYLYYVSLLSNLITFSFLFGSLWVNLLGNF